MNLRLRRGESPTANAVYIGDLTLVFSYETCVAFALSGYGWVASENIWSRTTGKHLNQETPRGVTRVPHEEFERKLQAAMAHVAVGTEAAIADLREIDALKVLDPSDPQSVANFVES